MEKIRVENLSVKYKENKTVFSANDNISLSVNEGEFVCIIGPSGCGKSTFLSVLEGLNKNSTGKVFINKNGVETELKGPGTDRAVVFQHYSLFPWLTAKKNVIFAMKQAKIKGTKFELEKKAEEYLDKVSLLYAKDKYPSQMSGGMQQRVAIARALAMNSEVLLMDEPFGAIDPKTRRELQELVSRLASEEKKTVLFVTHDIDEAILLADRIVFMRKGQIIDNLNIELAKPRTKEKLIAGENSAAYSKITNHLMSLFYQDVAEKYGTGDNYL